MPDDLLHRKHWLNRPDVLMAAACSIFVSACLLLILPSIGTLFLEVLAGAVILTRAWILRVRERKAAQLHLEFPSAGSDIRRPDRYDLVLIIVAILSYGATAGLLRLPEMVTRIAPLLVFAAGLLAKNPILYKTSRRPRVNGRRHAEVVSMDSDERTHSDGHKRIGYSS